MKHVPLALAAIAVIVATLQAFLSLRAQDDNIEAVVAGRRLDACAEIGAAATDFVFRAEAAQAAYNEATARAVSDGPRALAHASYLAAYLLPQDAAQESAVLVDLSQRIVAALSQRQESDVVGLMRQFDEANRTVQESCRLVIQGSRFAP
jgi:DNA-binding GntR family transcriptional regulator